MRVRTRHRGSGGLLCAALLSLTGGLGLTACNAVHTEAIVTAAVPADAKPGGVLRVGITAPAGIDPLNAYEPVGKLISAAMCDTIVAIDPVTGQLRSAIADRWVQSNGSDVTVKLKHGIKFSDGSVLKVRDVNFSLQQLIAPANGAYAAGLAKQFSAFAAAGGSTDVLDDPNKQPDVANAINTFDFQLAATPANAGALRSFAEPAMAPVSRDATMKQQSTSGSEVNPICVGPYVLSKPYKDGDPNIVLKRSKTYYAGNQGYSIGGAGYPDEIDFTVYKSAAAVLQAYDQHKVDVAPVPSLLVPGVKDTKSLVFGAATGVEYIGFPLASSNAFSDVNLRTALSEATDRTKLATTIFGPSTIPANGFVPPALSILEGPSAQGKNAKGAPLLPCSDTTPAKPNLTAARAHLAGDTSAPTSITLQVNADGRYVQMANELASEWKSGLGIDVKVQSLPWTQYLATATAGNGFDTPFRIRWSSDAITPSVTYNDQSSFLNGLFSGDPTTGGDWTHYDENNFRYGLTEELPGITDQQRRGVAFEQLSQFFCQKLPLIPLVFDRPAFLVRSTIVGSSTPVPVGRNGVLLLRDLYLKS